MSDLVVGRETEEGRPSFEGLNRRNGNRWIVRNRKKM